jgi:hypothetical protein
MKVVGLLFGVLWSIGASARIIWLIFSDRAQCYQAHWIIGMLIFGGIEYV